MFSKPRLLRRRGRRTAFSLIEIMVVLVLIGLLASIVTLNVQHFLFKGRINAAKAELARITEAVNQYKVENGALPTNDQGLAVLTQKGANGGDPLLSHMPVDPWGHPYEYSCPGSNGQPFDIICLGADGRDGGDGENADFDNWSATGGGNGSSSTSAAAQP